MNSSTAAAVVSEVDGLQAHANEACLSPDQLERVRWAYLPPHATAGLWPKALRAASMRIPYFDLDGDPTGFFRIRYLGELPGFESLKEKPRRYSQPPGTIPEVYLPPLLDRPWSSIARDAGTEIIVTEGEKKAAAGCAIGIPTIGLGGVDMWRAAARGLALLPALAAFQWVQRKVAICFDSDIAYNMNVLGAQNRLARALTDLGAVVTFAPMPSGPEGSKLGLDDFLRAHPEETRQEALREHILKSPQSTRGIALHEMNERVIYIESIDGVIERSDSRVAPMNVRTFKDSRFAPFKFNEYVPKAREVKTAQAWIEWKGRATVRRLDYLPGQPRIVTVDGDPVWNTWWGWGVESVEGPVEPWTRLLDMLFQKAPAQRVWFEQWCAYPIQHPGTKLYTAALLWSIQQGIGKSLVGELLGGVYGASNYALITADAFKGGFNAHWARRSFALAEEITGSESRRRQDAVKHLITQATAWVNDKYVPVYSVRDCLNYLLASNHPDSLALEDEDRRIFVHEIDVPPPPDSFYAEMSDLKHGGRPDNWRNTTGLSHLRWHLEHLDLTGFSPTAKAPRTEARADMIDHGRTSLGAWVQLLRTDPDRALEPFAGSISTACPVFTAAALASAFDAAVPNPGRRTSPGAMGVALRRGGFPRPRRGDRAGMLYVVRGVKKWAGREASALQAEFFRHFGVGRSPQSGRAP